MERQTVTKVPSTPTRNHSVQPQSAEPSSPIHWFTHLQRSIGNQATQRLIKSHYIQAKLSVSSPGDPLEQEADHVADTVMRMPDAQVNPRATVSHRTQISHVHRKCPECEEEMQRQPVEEEEEKIQPTTASDEMPPMQRPCSDCGPMLQRSANSSSPATKAPSIVHDVLRSPGQSLSPSTRAFMEPRFGKDFGHVRVHTDQRAAESASAVNALAYTVGHDVVFAPEQFGPGTTSGDQLLAHELAHVVQQTGGAARVQRRTDTVGHRPIRPNARACLLHLHGDEVNARSVADSLYTNYCVNFAFIEHPGRRLIKVDVPGHARVTCLADPNRIFQDAAVTSQWASWNSRRPACLSDPVMSAAQNAVFGFRDNQLCPAIRECRGQAASPGVCTQVQGLPTAVFHNNTPAAPLTIHSYKAPHGSFHNETETDPARLTDSSTTPPTVLSNPHIEPRQNQDNFVLATDPADFRFFVSQHRNVVLQKLNPPNDGSLSVALSAGRYLNIEAQLPTTRPARNLPTNQAIGEEALSSLGVARGPCPASPAAAPATAPSQTGPTTNVTPAPTTVAPAVQRSVAITRRTPGLQLQPNQITSADLAQRTPPDLDRFMRRVFDFQVQLWTSQGATYVHQLPASDLVSLSAGDTAGRPVMLRRGIAEIVHDMLEAARRDLTAARTAGDPNARGVTALAVRSGYRSATEQLSIWETMFPRYYRETLTQRQAMTGGEHGDDAARFLANYFNERVHSPGFSQHQHGETVDLTFDQQGWIPPDSNPRNITRWRSSWFFGWLTTHAWEYGFMQNPMLNEPWHWEFKPAVYLISQLLQFIARLIAELIRIISNMLDSLQTREPGPGQQG